MLILIADASEV